MHVSDIARLFADEGEPRIEEWISHLAENGDPIILPSDVAELISDYCDEYDLSLSLPLALSE
jgi:hypothetical protein